MMSRFLQTTAAILLSVIAATAQIGPAVEISGANWRQQELTSPVIDRVWEPKTGLPGDNGTKVSETRVNKMVQFVYTATVENLSGREIKGIAWEYNFADSKGKLLKSNVFYFPRVIRKGKRREVWATSQFAPTPMVAASALEKDGGTYVESVGLRCIVFKGGGVWKRPDAPDADCEGLKRSIE